VEKFRAMSEITLIHGDCLDKMDSIADQSIDLVLSDPPYGTTACKWDSVIPLQPMWRQLERVIKENGAIILMSQTPFDKVLGASNLKWLRYEIIWEKGTATGFLNAKKMPMKAHENILVFYRRLPIFNPQMTSGHAPMNSVYNNGESECYGKQLPQASRSGSTSRYPRSVQKFGVVTTGTLMPTQKPIDLMEYLIATYTNKGDTVLDFAMGSGTTGVACKNLDRNFTGIELDKNCFDIARGRIND